MEFRGDGWTTDSMTARCAQEGSSTYTEGEGCNIPEVSTAGYCVKDGASDGQQEYQVMIISSAADCDENKMACTTFVGGAFMASSTCDPSVAGGDEAGDASATTTDGGAATSAPDFEFPSTDATASLSCSIAPGAIGAAHQNAFSPGYSTSCPDTPGQESPYMWPLRWAADYESQSMAFGSDEVVFTSRGRTYYSLDNNRKRSDTTYQKGIQRTIGQGPCDESDVDQEWKEQGLNACNKDQTDGTMTTMLHLGNNMYFVSWKNDTVVEPGELDASKIEDCSVINLAVIGNIRPDWFLDKRGDDTDTQYLGNQHLFYDGNVPKLAKQWRKKDFASQYFVMSMMENPAGRMANETEDVAPEDKVNWPLILNIPGEGFGDDSLQRYSNHQLLTEEHDELFTLIERYQEIGGECVAAGGGDVGPPILDVHIPSNLEVDPNSWYSNEYTFSPIWEVPAKEDESMASMTSSAKAVTEVSDRVTVESCYDESTKTIDMSIHYADIEPTSEGTLPWMALGYRPADVCAMTPPSGGNTPIVLVTHASSDVAPQAHAGSLVPEAKSLSSDAFATMYQTLVPLEDTIEYTDVSVEAPMVDSSSTTAVGRASTSAEDTVVLNFKQVVDSKPEVMYLMYAIGSQSQLGFHTTRACFEVTDFPSCPSSQDNGVVIDISEDEESTNGATQASSGSQATASITIALTLAMAALVAF